MLNRVAITGMSGFLGWHTACRLRALHGSECVPLGREALADAELLSRELKSVDGVIHVAGVNRAPDPLAVEHGNVLAAQQLAEVLARADRSIPVSYANSVQCDSDTPYGRGKRRAGEILRRATSELGSSFADVVLPNLFGEHGRPDYNSFVATFVHRIVNGLEPQITEDRIFPLLHAQDAAAELIAGLEHDGERLAPGEKHGVGEVADILTRMHDLYVRRGEIPPLTSAFHVNLFNTFRAAAWTSMFPFNVAVHTDQRGSLFESVRSHGGTGQVFASTTKPGATRGEHYHLRKVERFTVLRGQAEISLRRLFSTDIVRFRLDGDEPAFVDMPTMWAHNIKNIGEEDLVTLFWSDQLLDAERPDQYAERVEVA